MKMYHEFMGILDYPTMERLKLIEYLYGKIETHFRQSYEFSSLEEQF